MKTSLIVIALVFSGSMALAEVSPPETVTLIAKNGNITFNHKIHAQGLRCSTCHGEVIGKLEPIGMTKGHALCVQCHKQEAIGPTKCGDCHKK